MPQKTKILAVDNDPDILRMTEFLLGSWGYAVATAPNGRAAIEAATAEPPDLILMDVNMEEMNGLEACERLKDDYVTSNIPVIILTSKDQVHDKIAGLGRGADDYVIKTVDPLELKARIEMVIRRTREQSSANPLTKLPGNTAIERIIQQRLEAGRHFSVCYCDLDNFKAYNDKYGYKAGDRVIIHTGQLLIRAARQLGNPDDFVGHIGGDDFVVVTTSDRQDAICTKIMRGFDRTIPDFYDQRDRERQFIEVENRSGTLERFPVMSITIAVVNNLVEKFQSSRDIAERAAALKKYLKRFKGSNYLSEDAKSVGEIPLYGVPMHKVPLDELLQRELTPQEGFILSRINGELEVRSILKICPFAEQEVLVIIKQFLDDDLIELKTN